MPRKKKVRVDWKSYATELANEYIILHKKVTHLVHLLAEEYNWNDEEIKELIEATRTEFQSFKEPTAEFMKKLVKEDDPHNAD